MRALIWLLEPVERVRVVAIDRPDGFVSDPLQNAGGLNRCGDMVNEVDEQPDSDECQPDPREHRNRRHERIVVPHAADRPQHHDAVGEDAHEGTEHQLGGAVGHEGAQHPGRVLAGSERKRDDGDGEDDAGDRNDGTRDGAQHPPRAFHASPENQRKGFRKAEAVRPIYPDQGNGQQGAGRYDQTTRPPTTGQSLLPIDPPSRSLVRSARAAAPRSPGRAVPGTRGWTRSARARCPRRSSPRAS